MKMNRKLLTSSALSLLLLTVALVGIFGLTSLDLESANEVSSVAGETTTNAVAEEESRARSVGVAAEADGAEVTAQVETKAQSNLDETSEADPIELASSDTIETVETATAEPAVDGQPATEIAGVSSLQTVGPFTGDVEVDFDVVANPDIVVVEDNGIDVGVDPRFPDDVISGWEIEDIRLHFVESEDTLFVGINFLNVGGDPEGDGDPATGQIQHPTIPDLDGLGIDEAAWGTGEAFSVLLDLDGDGVLEIIAGVHSDTTIAGFQVAEPTPVAAGVAGINLAYGTPIPDAIAIAPNDTSATSPDIEFAIGNLSTFVNVDAERLGVFAFAGSFVDLGIGEENVGTFAAPAPFDNPLFAPAEPALTIEKSTNGEDADTAAEGPQLAVGSTATFEYVVTNTGQVDLVDIVVTDDILGEVCTIATLVAGESTSCDATATVTAGAYVNIGTATGFADDGSGNPTGDEVTDTDPSNHTGVAPGIALTKTLDGQDLNDPDGELPTFEIGTTITFDFLVQNTGDFTLTDITLVDDVLGPITCPRTELDAGESMTCSGDHVVSQVGIRRNEGTVNGQPVDAEGMPIGDPIEALDPAHHAGECVNIQEGPVLYRGAQTIWNTNLTVGDDSTLILTTSENGDSPNQPNEQVYVEVAGELYGPSPAGLGTITLDIEEGGQVRVLHISEVEDGLFSANSVVPSLCGSDLEVIVPVCTDLVGGPALFAGGRTEWVTGLIAEDDSTIRVNTSENGGSPGQPNEQVFLQVGDDIYGPTFQGLGDIEFDIATGGPVTVLHWSVISEDRSSANSVVPAICGDALNSAPGPTCSAPAAGPRLYQGGQTVWHSGYTAAAGSEITIVTFDDLSDFRQPHEQVYVRVGETVYGPTPVEFGELTFTASNGGPVTILHYSNINGLQSSANSVEFTICGDGLSETVMDYLNDH